MTSLENPSHSRAAVSLERLAPVLIVDAVEPCVRFWAEHVGCTIENQVPGPDGTLVFSDGRPALANIAVLEASLDELRERFARLGILGKPAD